MTDSGGGATLNANDASPAPADSADDLRTWIVVLDNKMDYDQAREFGKVIGAKGYTGHFINGSLARHISLIPKLKDEIRRMKGGDQIGEATND